MSEEPATNAAKALNASKALNIDQQPARSHPRRKVGAVAKAVPVGAPPPRVLSPGQYYVEVIVYITGGLLGLDYGHADIALINRDGGTVYGKHDYGDGNNLSLIPPHKRTWKKRGLDDYINEEWINGNLVFIVRREVSKEIFERMSGYLEEKWKTDISYDLYNDNCAQQIGYVLKANRLLSNWTGDSNKVDDSKFWLPEGNLLDDWLRPDNKWKKLGMVYLFPDPQVSNEPWAHPWPEQNGSLWYRFVRSAGDTRLRTIEVHTK